MITQKKLIVTCATNYVTGQLFL